MPLASRVHFKQSIWYAIGLRCNFHWGVAIDFSFIEHFHGFFTCEPRTTICGSWIESEPTVLNTSCNLFTTGIKASILWALNTILYLKQTKKHNSAMISFLFANTTYNELCNVCSCLYDDKLLMNWMEKIGTVEIVHSAQMSGRIHAQCSGSFMSKHKCYFAVVTLVTLTWHCQINQFKLWVRAGFVSTKCFNPKLIFCFFFL